MKLTRLFAGIALVATTVTAQTTLTIDGKQRGADISPSLYGLFFEEINHAGDGGLYAELIRNRSFEDNDKQPEFWKAVGGATISLTSEELLNKAQHHALHIQQLTEQKGGVENTGFWGINAVKGRTYDVTLWVRSTTGYRGNLSAQLCGQDGTCYGSVALHGIGKTWKKLNGKLKSNADDPQAVFRLMLDKQGTVDIDVVSLFPPTYKNRPNGLRPDLAQMLADTKPAFIRFPGGCYIEGENTIDNAFQWRKTIGPIEQRPGHGNYTWGYRSSDGLGFDEYLQMCEDMEADALFVVNIGLGHNYVIPLNDLRPYIQDVLDALEYANGSADTPMGKLRAKYGHVKPYGIKYIELGNENYQAGNDERSLDYAERYRRFREAILERFPDVMIVGNVEAWGTDAPSWRNEHPVDFLDEHYYRSHTWMRDNFTKYDIYERPGHKIYNGEYAANARGTYGKNGTIQSALGEAIYMMGMERNADICAMASFAPIFTHEENRAWDYDMIHHTASTCYGTPSYYVQQLFSTNLGTQAINVSEEHNMLDPSVHTKAGVGTWKTSVSYKQFALLGGNDTFIAKDNFTDDSNWAVNKGQWEVGAGTYQQTSLADACTSIYKATIDDAVYELNVDATKLGGEEGFLILFNYLDEKNYCWWNIGGWGNTASGLERSVDGSHTIYDRRPFVVKTGHTYQIKVRISGNVVVGSIDGVEMLRTSLPQQRAIYACAAIDEQGKQLIVKLVNPEPQQRTVNLNFKNLSLTDGTLVQLKGQTASDENTLEEPRRVIPTAPQPIRANAARTFETPPYSLNILRFNIKD